MKSWKYNPLLTERDKKVLEFLWRFRVATFMALKTKFFPEVSAERVYKRIRQLVVGGFIDRFVLSGTNDRVYGLGSRGMDFLQERILPELKAKVRKPQSPYHDLLSGAALLGNWFNATPEGVQIVSEQELRQTEVLEIPYGLRKDAEHFPDGIWIFKSGKIRNAFALEVETTAKSFERYVAITTFYNGQLFFEHVIWIVPSQRLAQKILEAAKSYSTPREGLHIFVLQQDFEEHIWNSRLLNKSLAGWSLADLMREKLSPDWTSLAETVAKPKGATRKQAGQREPQSEHLNFRISIARLRGYKKQASTKKA